MDCKQIGQMKGSGYNEMTGRVYSPEGAAPSVRTFSGGGTEIKIAVPEATKEGYSIAEVGDSINLAYPNSKTRRGRVGKGVAQTIMGQNNQCVITEEPTEQNVSILAPCNFAHKAGDGVGTRKRVEQDVVPALQANAGFTQASFVKEEPLVWDGFNQQIRQEQGTVGTITRNVGADLKRNGQGIIEPIALDEQNGYMREDGTIGALSTDGSSPKHNNRIVEPQEIQNYRVRKLTPRECFRLQGVKDEDFEKVEKNQSDSSLYHLAGDSITSVVLCAIFGQLFGLDWKKAIAEVQDGVMENPQN